MAGDEKAIARGYELDQETESRLPSDCIAHKTLYYVYIWFDGLNVAANAAEFAASIKYIGKGGYNRLGDHFTVAQTTAIVAEEVNRLVVCEQS